MLANNLCNCGSAAIRDNVCRAAIINSSKVGKVVMRFSTKLRGPNIADSKAKITLFRFVVCQFIDTITKPMVVMFPVLLGNEMFKCLLHCFKPKIVAY